MLQPLNRKIVKNICLFFLLVFISPAFMNCDEPGVEDDWIVQSPEDHGLDSASLDKAAEDVEAVGGRYGIVFIKDSVVVYEKYWSGDLYTQHTGYSVTKSFSGALIGIALTQGLIDLEDYVSDYTEVPSAMDPDAKIKHVLSQTSHTSPPGSDFDYQALDTNGILPTLSEIISSSSGMRTDEFRNLYLFEPLGIKNTTWEGDSDGNLGVATGSEPTCRDLARLGQLYLNGGTWKGKRIIDEEYIYQSTHATFPDANTGYGYLWWVNPSPDETRSWEKTFASGTGAMVPNAPDNVFFAIGMFGQLIIVIPDHNMVVTTMGNTLALETLYTLRDVWDAILPTLP